MSELTGVTRLHVVLALAGTLIAALVFVASRLSSAKTLIDIILMLALVGTGALLLLVVLP
jgi:hypothetical protein